MGTMLDPLICRLKGIAINKKGPNLARERGSDPDCRNYPTPNALLRAHITKCPKFLGAVFKASCRDLPQPEQKSIRSHISVKHQLQHGGLTVLTPQLEQNA